MVNPKEIDYAGTCTTILFLFLTDGKSDNYLITRRTSGELFYPFVVALGAKPQNEAKNIKTFSSSVCLLEAHLIHLVKDKDSLRF